MSIRSYQELIIGITCKVEVKGNGDPAGGIHVVRRNPGPYAACTTPVTAGWSRAGTLIGCIVTGVAARAPTSPTPSAINHAYLKGCVSWIGVAVTPDADPNRSTRSKSGVVLACNAWVYSCTPCWGAARTADGWIAPGAVIIITLYEGEGPRAAWRRVNSHPQVRSAIDLDDDPPAKRHRKGIPYVSALIAGTARGRYARSSSSPIEISTDISATCAGCERDSPAGIVIRGLRRHHR